MNFFNFNKSRIENIMSVNRNTFFEIWYLFKDSTRMEKHRATRNTELTRAPRTSARAQPKVFFDHFLGDIWTETVIRWFIERNKGHSTYLDWKKGNNNRDNITEHMKTVSHQCHRICDVANHQFNNEKTGSEPDHGKQTAFLSRISPHSSVNSPKVWRSTTLQVGGFSQ